MGRSEGSEGSVGEVKRSERWNWSKRGREGGILVRLCFCSDCPEMMNGLQIPPYS